MQSLAIMSPLSALKIVGSGPAGPNYALAPRVLAPDPKEAFMFPASQDEYYIDIDLGVAMPVDSVYVGYHNSVATNQMIALQTLGNFADLPINATVIEPTSLIPLGLGLPYHSFMRAEGPSVGRYWRFIIRNRGDNPPLTVGVLALGLTWQAQFGHEWGAGRTIEDTGSSERLFGGGFAIDDGVAAGGYQWTFGDLQPDEVRRLYQIVKDRRTTRSLLVVEDPDQTDGLNERIHWGLLRKLDAYERLDPLNTKWSLQIGDWA